MTTAPENVGGSSFSSFGKETSPHTCDGAIIAMTRSLFGFREFGCTASGRRPLQGHNRHVVFQTCWRRDRILKGMRPGPIMPRWYVLPVAYQQSKMARTYIASGRFTAMLKDPGQRQIPEFKMIMVLMEPREGASAEQTEQISVGIPYEDLEYL